MTNERTEIRFLVKDGHVIKTLDLPTDYLGKTGQEALHYPNDQETNHDYHWSISVMDDQEDGSTLFVFTRSNPKKIIQSLINSQ